MKYTQILIVEEDDDFNKLAHLGKSVEFLLIPNHRKDEFFKSNGWKCLFMIPKEILFYERRRKN